MITDIKIWEAENERLKRVLCELERQISSSKSVTGKFRTDIVETQRGMRDYIDTNPSDLDDMANIWQYQVDIDLLGKRFIHYQNEFQRLEKMQKSPYFGRIDFKEEGEALAEQVYIGISGLADKSKSEQLIYDWRSPVASMFYDYETGRARYTCPAGIIEGDLILKRQYKIWDRIIEYMFDSSIRINDDILQQILGKSADARMRSIVTTIQREQNQIIRDESSRLLMVYGPAGSGKTSIALHRIAYLLYRYRESVRAGNIIIFSPNSIFSDYISNVLPELGEDNMHRLTFMDYASGALGEALAIESPARQLETLLNCENKEKAEAVSFKSSQAFLEILKQYVDWLEKEHYTFEDIALNEAVFASAAEMDEMFRKDFSILKLHGRLIKIKNKVNTRIDPMIRKRAEELQPAVAESGEYANEKDIKAASILLAREEYRPVKESLEGMTRFGLMEAYIRLFETEGLLESFLKGSLLYDIDRIKAYTINELKAGRIPWEDAAPLIYLKGAVGDVKSAESIRHVVIDEAQDYTPVQYEVIRQSFGHCSFSVLGDFNQSINPFFQPMDYAAAQEALGLEENSKVLPLTRSYRSTREITLFTRNILKENEKISFVDRPGEKPKVIGAASQEDMYHAIENDIMVLKSEGMKTIGIICINSDTCREAFERLSSIEGIRLVTGEDSEFTAGVLVLPSYLAKGLEFDAVVVCGADKAAYKGENHRKLFYTVLTRALHRLHVYYTGRPSGFLKEIDRELYTEKVL